MATAVIAEVRVRQRRSRFVRMRMLYLYLCLFSLRNAPTRRDVDA